MEKAEENRPSPGAVSEKQSFSDLEYQRDRLFDQDPELLKAVSCFATKIRSCPPDPKCPEIEPRALLVGGFVRDALLGKHPKDADMEVYGVSVERLESILDQLFGDKVTKAGKAFKVFKVNIAPGIDFDVSIPRRDSKTGKKQNEFETEGNPSMSIEAAAKRRDFTFNSMAADILSGEVYDPYAGIKDLENKILRITDEKQFQEDPLRVYRAVQFISRMECAAEPKTFSLLKEMVKRGDLDYLPKERITEELKKLFLKSEKPSLGLEFARSLGIIEKYYPELNALVGTPQEPEWHPEGDVWTHTMMAVDAAENISRESEREFTEEEMLEVLIGTLCHDFGKPDTTEVLDGRVRSLGHEKAGIKPSKEFLGRLSFGESVEKATAAIAANHLKPSAHYRSKTEGKITEKQYVNILRKLLRKISPVSWRVLIAASESDSRGRTFSDALTKEYSVGKLFKEAILAENLDVASKKQLIQGKDIIEVAERLGLKIKPGPKFGEAIRTIEAERDDGKISTREEALLKLEKILKNIAV
ncbi:MAG: HD domain-containing protein [Candidatus Liptonbacteria bacterium]|nr:HD domain-containing protein [Candidatus Liptonbacteria bacterium]